MNTVARDTVVGVDGWKDGWVAAMATGRRIEWRAYRQPLDGPRTAFASMLVDQAERVIALDLPIGTTDGPRDVDTAARVFLRDRGGPWQSIFLTPPTGVVEAFIRGATHAEAMASRPAGSSGTSIQAWNLIAKIVEVRDAVAANPSAAVVEAHPECSFRALDASIGLASKKTGLGVGRRLRALRTVFDLDLADAPAEVPVDDLLDACAVAWTARRYVDGLHHTLPPDAIAPPRVVI